VSETVTIGQAARLSGVPPKTIRFYEEAGVVPAPARTPAGYRSYGPNDVRRLRLAGRARAMGLPLPEVAELVAQAFGGECRSYVADLGAVLERRCAEVDRRIAELTALRAELAALAAGLRRLEAAPAGRAVATCGQCPIIDQPAGGDTEETNGARFDPIPVPPNHPGRALLRDRPETGRRAALR
jgi:MerR family copper efflux transcriptional regulator